MENEKKEKPNQNKRRKVRRNLDAFVWSSLDKKIIEFARQHPLIYDAKAGKCKKTERDAIVKSLWAKFVNTENTGKTASQCLKRFRDIARQYKTKKRLAKYSYSKFNDGRLSFLDYLVDKNMLLEKEPYRIVPSFTINSQKKDMKGESSSVNKLLNSEVVTLDMIGDILQLKRVEENVLVEDCSNRTSICSGEMDLMNNISSKKYKKLICESGSTITELRKANTIEKPLSSTTSVIVYDSTGIDVSAVIENAITNSQENTKTKDASQSTEPSHKETDENLTINTVDFFKDMGSYVSQHLSEKQQKKLRLMLRSLIAEQNIKK